MIYLNFPLQIITRQDYMENFRNDYVTFFNLFESNEQKRTDHRNKSIDKSSPTFYKRNLSYFIVGIQVWSDCGLPENVV